MNNIKKTSLLLIFYCVSINVFACSYNKAIFDDGKDGNDVHVNGSFCYDGNKITKPGNGEYSLFGKNGNGGSYIIDKDSYVFGGKLKSGEPANSYIGNNNSRSGNIYNNGNINNSYLDTSNNSKTLFGISTNNSSSGGDIYNNGHMTNPKINTSNNSTTFLELGKTKNNSKSGNIYNDDVIINK